MFTCCKNTFPNFNITHSHFQAFIHSFLVRWLDVSAKRKQKWKSKGKKKRSSDLCTRGSKGGSGFQKQEEKKKCRRLFYIVRAENLGWGTRDRGRLLEDMCAFWTLREKKWPALTIIFSFCFLSTDHTRVRFVLRLPVTLGLRLGDF